MRNKWIYKTKYIFMAGAIMAGLCGALADDSKWTTTELGISLLIFLVGILLSALINQLEVNTRTIYRDACRFKRERDELVELLTKGV